MSRELDQAVAERVMGYTIVRIDEECSLFTPGARWNNGGDYYSVEVVYAAPPDIAEQLERGERDDNDEWLVQDYSTDPAAAYAMEAAIVERGPVVKAAYLLALAKLIANENGMIGAWDWLHATPEQRAMAAVEAMAHGT